MPWETSDRKSRLPGDWVKIRQQVFETFGRRCYVVGPDGRQCENEGTEIDHVKAGDDHSMANLRPICSGHHKVKSSGEGHAAYNRKKRQAKWRAEKQFGHAEEHPGSKPHEAFRHPWQR